MPNPIETLIRGAVTKGVMNVAPFNRNRLAAPDTAHPYLTGIHAPMTEELTLTTLPSTGLSLLQLDGHYLRIGPNPVRAPIGCAPLVRRRRHGARHPAAGRQGALVLQPPDPLARGQRSARRGARAGAAPRRQRHRQHQRAGHAETGPWSRRAPTRSNSTATSARWRTTRSAAACTARSAPIRTWTPRAANCTPSATSARPTTIHHVVVDRDGRVRREEPIAVSHGPSIHDCMITPRYVLVFDLPVTFSMKSLLAGQPFPCTPWI